MRAKRVRKRRPKRRAVAGGVGSISLCMIVKNEARYLGQCLAGARDLVDQMVVVDTGSTDETVAIAEAAGAEVHHWAWRNDFSQARNVSLGYATGDWILILDGDECFADGAAAALRALDLGPAAPDAYDFEIINYSTDRHQRSEAMLQRQVRLFRNRPRFRYSGHVHNQIADLERGWPLEGVQVPVAVEHFGYTPTVWAQQRKVERLAMLERAVREQPDSAFVHYNLANHLKILERFDEALAHYRACLERIGDGPALEWHTMAPVAAAYCAHRSGRDEEAVALCDAVLEDDPGLADAHLRRAEALLALGRPDEVVRALTALLADPDRHAIKTASLSAGVPYRLARGLFELGRFAEALPRFEALESAMSDDVTVFTHQAACHLRLGDREGAARAIRAGRAVDPDDRDLRALEAAITAGAGAPPADPGALVAEGEALFGQGDLAGAAARFEAALEVAPEHLVALGNLGVVCHALGDADAAVGCFLRALAVDPAHRPTLVNLVEVLHARGEAARCVPLIERQLADAPEDPQLRALLGVCTGAG